MPQKKKFHHMAQDLLWEADRLSTYRWISRYYVIQTFLTTNTTACNFILSLPVLQGSHHYNHFYAWSQNYKKMSNSFIMSFRPSVHMGQLSSHWMHFYWIWYSRIFPKVKNIQVSLESNKNNRYFTWKVMYVYDTSLTSS